MLDVYVSRYVDQSPAAVMVGLRSQEQAAAGEPVPLHHWMWLVPVTWREDGADVLTGHLRVITVSGGGSPVTEVLLVGEQLAEDIDADLLLEGLLAGACPEAAADAHHAA